MTLADLASLGRHFMANREKATATWIQLADRPMGFYLGERVIPSAYEGPSQNRLIA